MTDDWLETLKEEMADFKHAYQEQRKIQESTWVEGRLLLNTGVMLRALENSMRIERKGSRYRPRKRRRKNE